MRLPLLVSVMVACDGRTEVEVPEVYEFQSRFAEGSSVDYSGQTFRHLLQHDLVEYAEDLTERIDQGYFPVAGDVQAGLEFYFDFDSATSGALAHDLVVEPGALQATYDDIATGKDLAGKLAGSDPEGQYQDWSSAFRGWTPGATPQGLVRSWFAEIDAAAVARSNGDIPLGPDGAPVPAVAVSADGLNRAELIQKFLYGALNLSQGTDDYLDDDRAGAGLLASNAEQSDEGPYTALEHAWDEGFGYFGVARDALTWDEDLLAGDGYADLFQPDGAIDLQTEVSWGVARYGAERDLTAVVSTDLCHEVIGAFLAGRALIAQADGELDAEALDALKGYRDEAVAGWERILAASAVHYVNETLVDMSRFGTVEYDFFDHSEHWSELKGLALGFQFNPRSALSAEAFDALHEAIGLAPVLPTADAAEIEAYGASLREARAILGDAFGFADENLGDDNGLGGW